MNKARMSLAWKLAVYYGAYLAFLLLLGETQPPWIHYLPVGGLEALQNNALLESGEDLVQSLLTPSDSIALFHDAMNLISALALALLVMIPIRWIYVDEDLNPSPNAGVASGLLLLPMVVTGIVFVVKFSLPLAFALTGIFAGVRYRTRLKNAADAYFTFAAIAIGLAAGTRAIGIGLVLAIFFAYTILFATPHAEPKTEAGD